MRVDPALGFLCEGVGFGVAGDPPRDESDECPPLRRCVAQLLGQGGRHDEVRAEPVIEVFAEVAGFHLVRQIAVGGRDELAGEAAVARVAEPLERARLQHAEELHLHRRIELADLVEEDGAQRRAHLEPSRAVLHRAGECAAAMAEQLRLDQRGRQRGGVEHVERARIVLGERVTLRIERDVARQADRARHELLAGAGRPTDQRGDVAHPLVERAAIATHVAREDGLPDGGAQPDDRRRVADDVADDVVERPADLEEARQQVRHVPVGHERGPRDLQEPLDVLTKPAVEADRPGGRAAVVEQAVEIVFVAAEQQVHDDVLVELQVFRARPDAIRQPRGQPLRQAQAEPPERLDVRHRTGLARGVPQRAAGHEVGAQRGSLVLDPLRQEGVAVREPGDRPGERAISGGEERHP